MIKKFYLLTVLLIATVLVLGCSDDEDKPSLVGTWELYSLGGKTELSDGRKIGKDYYQSLVMTEDAFQMHIITEGGAVNCKFEGTYTADDSKIYFRNVESSGKLCDDANKGGDANYTVTEDTLTFDFPNQKTLLYKRQ